MKQKEENKKTTINNNCCRRSFLKNCLATSAGVAFLGKGIKLFSQEEDEWRWVAFCGKRCDICGVCWTCKSEQGLEGNCAIKRCAIDIQNVPTCAHCDEIFTCDKYNDWEEQRDELIELKGTFSSSEDGKAMEKQYDFVIFPNPASNRIKILNPKNINASYELVNLQGKIVKKGIIESTEFILNISNIKPGNYILNLKNKRTMILSRKIIKN